MEAKITVIMPSLNVVNYIDECMTSVLAQTLKEIEILCIDAGSVDGTYERLKYYEQIDNRVHVFQSDRKSYGYQINLGIKNATGDYIGIVETDDFITSDMYNVLYDKAVLHNLDFIKADFKGVSGEKKVYTYREFEMFDENNYELYNQVIDPQQYPILHKLGLNIWRGIYKTSFLTNNNIWLNETSGAAFQDTGFHHLTLYYAKRVMYINEYYYMYRQDRNESSFRNPKTIMYDYHEYRLLEERLNGYKDIDSLVCKNIYIKIAQEFLQHFKKTVEGCNYSIKEINTYKEYIDWFKIKLNEAFEKNIIDEEDFQKHEWFLLKFMIKYPNSYVDYLKVQNDISMSRIHRCLKMLDDKKIAVFGTGWYGAYILNLLEQSNKKIDFFLDNNTDKNGKLFYGVKIWNPDAIHFELENYKVIVAIKKYQVEITQQLLQLGVHAEDILLLDKFI